MKYRAVRDKITRQTVTTSVNDASAGEKGISMTPPEYGIDFVDQGMGATIQRRANKTGLPDRLKAGIESLSGMSMDDVKVHYNSSSPAQFQASAYAQGTDVHLGPDQEKHLPHEAWHVVQQRQGRVRPTTQMKKGIPVNDEPALENEADVMGAKAQELGSQLVHKNTGVVQWRWPQVTGQVLQASPSDVIQLTAAENLQILKDVETTNPDGSYATEGSKGDKIKALRYKDFVVVGSKGTWHHIYPRNLLKKSLENISKYLVATNGEAGKMTETAKSHTAIANMAANFSMGADGKNSNPGLYYWKPGNGFLGVLTNYRSDDPGSLVEHEKPPSMNKGKYQEPRDWGKGLESLSAAIGKLSTLTAVDELSDRDASLDHFATNINTLSKKLDSGAYRSIDVEGKDWKRKDRTIAWGAVSKNYELVK